MECAARHSHKALVKLEQAGMLTLLATQNFDALHEKAGNSDNVIVNLHGTIGTSHCMKCHQEYLTADIMARLDEEPDPLPSQTEVSWRYAVQWHYQNRCGVFR